MAEFGHNGHAVDNIQGVCLKAVKVPNISSLALQGQEKKPRP